MDLLELVSPARTREKLVDWPLPIDGGAKVRVWVRVLGVDEMEGAYCDALAYFKKKKVAVKPTDTIMVVREHTELIFRAFMTEDRKPIASSADAVAKYPSEILSALYEIYSDFQQSLSVVPPSQEALDLIVEELKKNTRTLPLAALHSTWLIGLISTLVSRLSASTTPSERG